MATIFTSEAVKRECYTLAKGDYQEALLGGWSSWTGSDLKGKAKSWGMKYWRSRAALLDRIAEAGIPIIRYGETVVFGAIAKRTVAVIQFALLGKSYQDRLDRGARFRNPDRLAEACVILDVSVSDVYEEQARRFKARHGVESLRVEIDRRLEANNGEESREIASWQKNAK